MDIDTLEHEVRQTRTEDLAVTIHNLYVATQQLLQARRSAQPGASFEAVAADAERHLATARFRLPSLAAAR